MNAETLAQLRRDLDRYPRMHGYYLLNSVQMPANWQSDEEHSLSSAFELLDDHPWMPVETHPNDQYWTDYEVFETEAREQTVAALVGGNEIGHARETIPQGVAASIWESFRKQFSPQARFFVRLGLGNPEHVFQRGTVVVDEETAGCLWVVESD